MRKMKRFFAVLLSAALLCPMNAYADFKFSELIAPFYGMWYNFTRMC